MRLEDEFEEYASEPVPINPSSFFEKAGQFVLRHLVDSTAILMAMTPIYIFVELVILRMSVDVSFRARLVIVSMTYLGTGLLVAKGRDFSKRFFGLDQLGVAERKILVHDLFYLVAFNAFFGPIVYLLSRASWTELIQGTLFAMGLSFFTGPVNGFFIDAIGELTGLRKSDRLPATILSLSRMAKLTLFFALLAGWIGGFILIYRQYIFSTPV
ncbi:MAG: hypothetical protein AB8G95_31105 [Anaerolineae bacterium]